MNDTFSPATFGALPSEFDTPERVAASFSTVLSAVSDLVYAYQTGKVTSEAAGRVLSDVLITDDSNIEWTVGASTLRWYRRLPGGAWRVASPPEQDQGQSSTLSAEASVNAIGKILSTV
jgi:hypothetical protein